MQGDTQAHEDLENIMPTLPANSLMHQTSMTERFASGNRALIRQLMITRADQASHSDISIQQYNTKLRHKLPHCKPPAEEAATRFVALLQGP
jgi:hypothetical protein